MHEYVKLGQKLKILNIKNYEKFLEVLEKRLDSFVENGCRYNRPCFR